MNVGVAFQNFARDLVTEPPLVKSCIRHCISAALDVLHHQHAERKVWKLLHGKRVRLVCNYSCSHVI